MIPDQCTEAEALDDIMCNGDDDDMQEAGEFFGLPRRVTLNSIRADIAAINSMAFENSKVERLRLYEVAKAAKVHTLCKCPTCSKEFTKKSYQQAFCSNKGPGNCKDSFWNRQSTTRAARAQTFASRR